MVNSSSYPIATPSRMAPPRRTAPQGRAEIRRISQSHTGDESEPDSTVGLRDAVTVPRTSDDAATARAVAGGGADQPRDVGRDMTTELFRLFARRVYAYVRLRAAPDLADDVVADTFLTAWRLRESVPDGPLPWLLVIARNALSNRQRSERRGTRLVVAMASVAHLAHEADAAEDVAVDRAAVLAALAELRPEDREALLLVAWDGLTVADAATVAGCSERTFARRLRRARSHVGLTVSDRQAATIPPPEISATDNPKKESR